MTEAELDKLVERVREALTTNAECVVCRSTNTVRHRDDDYWWCKKCKKLFNPYTV